MEARSEMRDKLRRAPDGDNAFVRAVMEILTAMYCTVRHPPEEPDDDEGERR